jgi:Zn-dependent M28 family amino/carboxypeptidase
MRRSILFVVVTREEKGLLGSKYFATHPTVPIRSIVADFNVDMFLPIVPLRLVTVYGLKESDLGDLARQAAASNGVSVQSDPQPLRNVFIRSDHYNFILHGVPALMMAVGTAPGSPEELVLRNWMAERYHAPSDDTSQPVDLNAAAQFEEVTRSLIVATANEQERPQWKQNSLFRRYANTNWRHNLRVSG